MTLYARWNSATNVATEIAIRYPGLSITENAEEGSVAISQLVVDDEDGELDFVGHRRIYLYESAASTSNAQVVYNGFITDRSIGRRPEMQPDSDEFVLGEGRRWTVGMADTNSLLSRRLITGSDGDRPAETDVARIQWLLDSNDSYLSNPKDNWTGAINTDDPVNLDAADLRGQSAFDVLTDCANRSGKNFYAWYDDSGDTIPPTNAGTYTLVYDYASSTNRTSTVRLTNVDADVDDSTTFAVLPDATLTRDPSRVYSGVLVQYDGGSTYVQSTNVVNLFQQRDTAVSNPNISTTAKATELANRYLADAQTEDDRISCRFIVPAAAVNDLRAGQRCQVKFSHLPGYSSSYTYARVLRRTVTQRSEDHYEIAVELSPTPGAPSLVQYKTGSAANRLILDSEPIVGHLLLALVSDRDGGGDIAPMAGWTKIARVTNTTGSFFRDGHAYYRVCTGVNPRAADNVAGDPDHDGFFNALDQLNSLPTTLMEWAGSYGGTFATQSSVSATTTMTCGGSISPVPSTGVAVVGLGVIGTSDLDYPGTSVTPADGVTELADQGSGVGNDSPGHWVGYRLVSGASGSYTVGGTISGSKSYCGISVVIEGEGP